MRKVLQETKSVERIEVSCDDCGEVIKARSYTCCMCHKDLCGRHYNTYGGFGSDYPPAYCKDCLGIGKPYIDEMNKLEKEYEEKCDLLSAEWREKCYQRRAKDEKSNFIPEFQDESNH